MFESLTERLGRTFKNLRGAGRLTEDNIKEALREVRLALLEACRQAQVCMYYCQRNTLAGNIDFMRGA